LDLKEKEKGIVIFFFFSFFFFSFIHDPWPFLLNITKGKFRRWKKN